MEFVDACNIVEQWVLDDNMSNDKWNAIVRQMYVQVAKKLDVFGNAYDVTDKFVGSLMSYYSRIKKNEKKTGDRNLLSSSKIVEIVKKRVKYAPSLENVKITATKALDILEAYFDVTVVISENKVKYYLCGINPTNDVATFSIILERWVQKCMDNNVMLTTQELADKINNIRSELPLLKKIKVSTRKILELLRDYFEVERGSTRKNKNVYKFVSDYPKNLKYDGQIVEIKPNRTIDFEDKHFDDMTNDEKKLYNHQNKINSLMYYVNMTSNTSV